MKVGTLLALDSVFKEKEWIIDETNELSLYSRASNLYEKLEEQEKEVLLIILEKMQYYTINNYEDLLVKCLLEMLEKYGNKEKYKFTPILQDKNKLGLKLIFERKRNEASNCIKITPAFNTHNKFLDIKSSMFVAYLLKSNTLQYHEKIAKMKINTSYYYTDEDIKNINNKKQKLVLIDDFIGTGDTALEAIKSLTNRGLNQDKIKVLSLICLESGYEKIKESNIDIYTGKIIKSVPKLLSEDKWNEKAIDKFEKTIISISEKVDPFAKHDNILGYGKSFSLVSMIRTPNNVPDFLWNNKKNNEMVIFPRFSKG